MTPTTPERKRSVSPNRYDGEVMTPKSSHKHHATDVLGSPLVRLHKDTAIGPDRTSTQARPLAAPTETAGTPAPSSPQYGGMDSRDETKMQHTPDSSPPSQRSNLDIGLRSPNAGLGEGFVKREVGQDHLGAETAGPSSANAGSPTKGTGSSLGGLQIGGQLSSNLESGAGTGSQDLRAMAGYEPGNLPVNGDSNPSNDRSVSRGAAAGTPANEPGSQPRLALGFEGGAAVITRTSSAGGVPTAASPIRNISQNGPRVYGTPGRQYHPSPRTGPWSTARVPGSATSSGRLAVSASSVPPMPLRTFFMTKEKADELDGDEARSALIKAIEAVDMYETATQQFRNLANQLHVQSSLATIARDESAQRQEVENTITQREVERLIVEVMGYNDISADAESIRQRLRKTRQRLKEMESLVDERGQEIAVLRQQLRDLRVQPKHIGDTSRVGTILRPVDHVNTTIQQPLSPQQPRVMTAPSGTAASAAASLNGLELLASQVLSGQLSQSPSDRRRRRPSSSSTISARTEDTEDDEAS